MPHSNIRTTQYPARRADYERVTSEVAAYANALATDAGKKSEPGERLLRVRELRTKGLEALTAAVLLERAEGASWSNIARALGMDESFVRARWEDFERDKNMELPRIVTG